MATPPFDGRIVANAILDEAARLGIQLSNLSLQKVLYFVHGHYLAETGVPLISDEFEAWQYGPVHRTVYHSFKSFEASPITTRARKLDPLTQKSAEFGDVLPEHIKKFLCLHAVYYCRLSPSSLIKLSHKEGSPWEKVWNNAQQNIDVGLRISNDAVLEYFLHLDSRLKGGQTH